MVSSYWVPPSSSFPLVPVRDRGSDGFLNQSHPGSDESVASSGGSQAAHAAWLASWPFPGRITGEPGHSGRSPRTLSVGFEPRKPRFPSPAVASALAVPPEVVSVEVLAATRPHVHEVVRYRLPCEVSTGLPTSPRAAGRRRTARCRRASCRRSGSCG